MNNSIEPTKAWESQLLKHDRQLLSCRFSPCGKFIFAAATDRFVHRWDLESETHTALDAHKSWVGGMDFHPDGKRLVTADYVGAIHCWNYADETPKPVWSVEDAHPNSIRGVAISSKGGQIATAGHDQIVRIWSADDGKAIHKLSGHTSPIFCCRFHPDGKSLVSAEQHGMIHHWDVSTGKLVRKLDASALWTDASLNGGAHTCGIRSLVFRDDNTLVCTGLTELKDGDRRGGNASILMLNWKDGSQSQMLLAKGAGYAEQVAFHREGFLSAACLTQEHGSLQFWKNDSESTVHTIKSNCRDLDLHPDGERLAVAEWEKFGKVGNNASTEKLVEFSPHHGLVRIYKMTPKPVE